MTRRDPNCGYIQVRGVRSGNVIIVRRLRSKALLMMHLVREIGIGATLGADGEAGQG